MEVSIIIPVYNGEKHIRRCVESAIQASGNCQAEIIIVDDGSTDKTASILKDVIKSDYHGHTNAVVRIERQENRGVGAARNRALKSAVGNYIVFLDADDCLEPCSIEHMIKRIKRDNTDACVGKTKFKVAGIPVNSNFELWREPSVDIINPKDDNFMVEISMSGLRSKMFRRELLDGMKFPEYLKWEDLPFMVAALMKAEKISILDETVYNYYIHLNTTVRDFFVRNKVKDIIYCLDGLKENLERTGIFNLYEQEYFSILTLHTMFRAQNVLTWLKASKKEKNLIIAELLEQLSRRYPGWKKDAIFCDEKYCYKNTFFNFMLNRLPP